MKILITGASGFIGSNLSDYLSSQGFIVKKAVRRNTENDNEIYWNINKNEYEPEDFEGFDVFINLSGENVFGYWTKEKKSKIVNSRLNSTKLLTKIISKLNSPPKTFISSSAIHSK